MPAGPDHSLGGHPHRSATDRPHPSRRHAPRRHPATTRADRHPRRRQQANDQTLRTGRRRNPASAPVPHETDGLVPFWAPRHLPLVPRTQALAASPAGGLEVAADPHSPTPRRHPRTGLPPAVKAQCARPTPAPRSRKALLARPPHLPGPRSPTLIVGTASAPGLWSAPHAPSVFHRARHAPRIDNRSPRYPRRPSGA